MATSFPTPTSTWATEMHGKLPGKCRIGGGAGTLVNGLAMIARGILRASLDIGRGWAIIVIALAVVIWIALMRKRMTTLQDNPMHSCFGAVIFFQ